MVTTINDSANIELKKPGKRPQYSTFPIGAPIASTERYGEYAIAEVKDIVPGDKVNVYLPNETKSYTLKAPMMQRPTQKQDAHFVPLQAIIPNSHDYLVANPLKGDDLPTNANTVVDGFENKIKKLVDLEIGKINEGIEDSTLIFEDDNDHKWYDSGFTIKALRLIAFIDMMYNPGNLLTAIEHPMFKLFNDTHNAVIKKHDVGRWVDRTIAKILQMSNATTWICQDGTHQFNVAINRTPQQGEVSFRTFFYMIKDNYNVTIADDFEIDPVGVFNEEEGEYISFKWNFKINSKEPGAEGKDYFNYSRAVAYQLICAHFYTNDKVDYIYTAELWRQNLGSLIMNAIIAEPGEAYSYEYNGIYIKYDWSSGYYAEMILNDYKLNDTVNVYEYYRTLFGWNRSLRFVDYFTGARTEPLAIGDTEVAVNDGKVSIIDVTEKTQVQKWLNAINKVGQRWESQVKELFGIEPKPDYHNPFWLAHTKNEVSTNMTENTADAQYSHEAVSGGSKAPAITGNFTGSNRFAFETSFDRYGILMVIRYYDIPRLYFEGISPFTRKATRFDMYNPYMQYIGDQEIYAEELDLTEPAGSTIFGYCSRDMEYKTAVGKARGGFIFNLPGYAFLADISRPFGPNAISAHIGPDYIRSMQTEIDDFYESLVGYSYDTYFHFIVLSHNVINAKRPMTYNPQILG